MSLKKASLHYTKKVAGKCYVYVWNLACNIPSSTIKSQAEEGKKCKKPKLNWLAKSI